MPKYMVDFGFSDQEVADSDEDLDILIKDNFYDGVDLAEITVYELGQAWKPFIDNSVYWEEGND